MCPNIPGYICVYMYIYIYVYTFSSACCEHRASRCVLILKNNSCNSFGYLTIYMYTYIFY